MNLQGVGCGDMEWIKLAQDRDKCVSNNEPSGSIQCGDFLTS